MYSCIVTRRNRPAGGNTQLFTIIGKFASYSSQMNRAQMWGSGRLSSSGNPVIGHKCLQLHFKKKPLQNPFKMRHWSRTGCLLGGNCLWQTRVLFGVVTWGSFWSLYIQRQHFGSRLVTTAQRNAGKSAESWEECGRHLDHPGESDFSRIRWALGGRLH